MSGKTYIDLLDRNIFPYVEYPGYDARYPTHSPLAVQPAYVATIRRVSAALFALFTKVTRIFQECPDEFFDDMEIPAAMRPYLRRGNSMDNIPTWLSRFDFVIDAHTGQIQMVEINADTPCAFIEAYYANGVAADFFQKENPNRDEYEKLKQWLYDVFQRTCGLKSRTYLQNHPVLFSCFHDYIEDYGTTLFLMRAMQEAVGPVLAAAITFESFYNLAILPDGRIMLPDSRTPSFIYRLHPMELLIEERADDDGSSLGNLLMKGYMDGKFQMMNPPEAIIMQSKGFQALVYALMKCQPTLFTPAEVDLIRNYIPACYFQRDFSYVTAPQGTQWIQKPIWGREGRGIHVLNEAEQCILRKEVADPEDIVCRDSKTYVVQQFVRQPTVEAQTDAGLLTGYLTLSCFMLGRTPSALYARFSPEEIAGTEAYWLPVIYE